MANRDKPSLRQQAKREITNLKRRAQYWEQKYHYKVDIPDLSNVKRVTKQFVQKIHDIRYTKLSEKQKKEYSRNYTRAYDRGEINIPQPLASYEPPTEIQFINNEFQDFSQASYDEDDIEQEPVDTVEEIGAYLNGVIEEILEVDTSNLNPGQSVNYMAREQLENLLWEARRNYGDKGFYVIVQDKSFVSRLQEAACAAQLVSNDRNGDLKEESKTEIIKFATILNNDMPLSLEQQEMFWATQRADIGLYDEE